MLADAQCTQGLLVSLLMHSTSQAAHTRLVLQMSLTLVTLRQPRSFHHLSPKHWLGAAAYAELGWLLLQIPLQCLVLLLAAQQAWVTSSGNTVLWTDLSVRCAGTDANKASKGQDYGSTGTGTGGYNSSGTGQGGQGYGSGTGQGQSLGQQAASYVPGLCVSSHAFCLTHAPQLVSMCSQQLPMTLYLASLQCQVSQP